MLKKCVNLQKMFTSGIIMMVKSFYFVSILNYTNVYLYYKIFIMLLFYHIFLMLHALSFYLF